MMKNLTKNFDLNKTLEDLEDEVWGKPPILSHLVKTCYSLRKKPLKKFTIEDLRIKTLQNESLKFLIPLAIETLKENPFASGNYYDGDLLNSVLSVKNEFWVKNTELYEAVEIALQKAESYKDEESQETLNIMLSMKIYNFRKNNPLKNEQNKLQQ